jgi:hypothetical protein
MMANEQWRMRGADECYPDLPALRDAVHRRRVSSRSDCVDLKALTAMYGEEDGQLVLASERHGDLNVTHWSFGQACAKVKAPPGYLRTLPPELAAANLNHGINALSVVDSKVKILMHDRSDGEITMQAVTSQTYGRIWDADVVDSVGRLVERSGGRFYNPRSMDPKKNGLYASDHDVFAFMIDGGSLMEIGPRAQINRGFVVWNSEVGAKTFGLTTFLFNVVCANHIIWGATDVNTLLIRHTQGGPGRFDSQAFPALKAWVDSSALPLETTIRKAQDYLLPYEPQDPDPLPLLAAFASKAATFTKAEIKGAYLIAKAEEGDCRTLWQLTQGLSAYAKTIDYTDVKVDLETRTGKLLSMADATRN